MLLIEVGEAAGRSGLTESQLKAKKSCPEGRRELYAGSPGQAGVHWERSENARLSERFLCPTGKSSLPQFPFEKVFMIQYLPSLFAVRPGF